MNIYLTELEQNETLTFPMLPESFDTGEGTIFLSYDIMRTGTIKIPNGEELESIGWEGIFPGSARRNAPFVSEWADPQELAATIKRFRQNRKKLRLLITDSSVNIDVYIANFSSGPKGGFGDIHYKISFIQAKDLVVLSEDELPEVVSNTASATEKKRPDNKKPPSTCTVVSGDSLWKLAQKHLGNGSRYTEIYNLNKDVIKSPDLIYPGQVLKLPEK